MTDRLRVTYVRSAIGYAVDQKRTVAALGLRRLHQTVEHDDNPALRGMVQKVRHLVTVETVAAEPKATATKPSAAVGASGPAAEG